MILNESEYNDNYGVPRMQTALKQRGMKSGIRRITRIMRDRGWLHKSHRKPHGLTHSTTEIQEKENLLKQDFSADRPLTKLLTDISQVQCEEGRLYISPIMDCCGGEVLALQMRDNMRKELCIDTFRSVTRRYQLEGGDSPLRSRKPVYERGIQGRTLPGRSQTKPQRNSSLL